MNRGKCWPKKKWKAFWEGSKYVTVSNLTNDELHKIINMKRGKGAGNSVATQAREWAEGGAMRPIGALWSLCPLMVQPVGELVHTNHGSLSLSLSPRGSCLEKRLCALMGR